tara:strand:+ start:6749 stop:8584 length:1836 start_codon:yes stop_codon:yes gene_type:complete
MCGISVFLSKTNNNILHELINSLSIIQNRGYDSVGVAIRETNNKWEIYKNASNSISDGLITLSKNIENKFSDIAIGHTRWATHGSKTDNNSHPHISMNKNIILIHNGIINNFQEIKKFLYEKKYIFYSETDTEVIANLIDYYLSQNNDIYKSIKLASDELNGTWALAIIYTLEPDKVYVTRHGSPLILGYNEDKIICTSEISGFIGLIYNYIILDNDDIITISKDGYKSNNDYKIKKLNKKTIITKPDPFKHWTIKEIYEQSKCISYSFNNGARILNNEIVLSGLNQLKEITDSINFDHLIILGCGTSYHAAMLCKYYFNNVVLKNFITIQSFDASEFDEQDIPISGKILSIVCSQSGETRDLIKAIDICKNKGSIIIGVVNVVDSLISRMVDCGVYINAGDEIAVASTKSFTSMLVVLSLIAMWFNQKYRNIYIINSLRELPLNIEKLLENNEFKNNCERIVEFINTNDISNIFILGKNKLFPIALEIALKIKEITYINAQGYPSGSLKHGPFSLLDKKALTFLLIDEKNKHTLMSTYYEISSRDTNCFIVTDSEITEINDSNILQIPKLLHYQEIIFTVSLQYLSYILSISRNINPDKPRNLAKVVTVE